jgi:hypothetical protein
MPGRRRRCTATRFVLERESGTLVIRITFSVFARDPRLRLVEEPLLPFVRRVHVFLKAVDGVLEQGDQEAVFTPLARRLPAQGREELRRNARVGLEQPMGVRSHGGSQIVEKQALKALSLEPKRCLLPEVRLPISGMLAHASLAMRTQLRSLLRIQTPRCGKEVEGVGAVRADDRVV